MIKTISFSYRPKLTMRFFSTCGLLLVALPQPVYADTAAQTEASSGWIWAGVITVIGLAAITFIIVAQNARLKRVEQKLQQSNRELEERAITLDMEIAERQLMERKLAEQVQILEAQQQTIQELSTPVIPVMDASDGGAGVIVMPLIGGIDTMRARDITRSLLAGITEHRAGVVILDITGVPIVDSGVAAHLNKSIQAARLKGAWVIVTGISDAVAETIVELGLDWSAITTLSDLRTGLMTALNKMGIELRAI